MRSLLLLVALCCCTCVLGGFYPSSKSTKMHPWRYTRRHRRSPYSPFYAKYGHVHKRRRGLLSSTECQWDFSGEQCVLSDKDSLDIIVSSGNPIARFFTTDYRCEKQQDEGSCNAVGYCFWDKVAGDCDYVDWSLRNGHSPCYTKADSLFDYLAAFQKCPTQLTEAECDTMSDCAWDEDDGQCEADVFKFAYGFTQGEAEEGRETVFQEIIEDSVPRFQELYNASDPDFEWRDVLDLEVPVMDCSADTHPKLCSYFQAAIRELLPPIAYCFGQYGSFDDDGCTTDPICQLDDGSCTLSDEQVSKSATNVLLEVTPADGYPLEIWTAALECNAMTQSDCPNDARCVWDSNDNRCESRSSFLFSILAKDGDKNDELCAFLSAVASIPCFDIYDENVCNAEEQCEFDDGDCDATTDAGMRIILGKKSELYHDWRALNADCALQNSLEACVA